MCNLQDREKDEDKEWILCFGFTFFILYVFIFGLYIFYFLDNYHKDIWYRFLVVAFFSVGIAIAIYLYLLYIDAVALNA